jgi:hypothetical protein
MQRLPVGKFLGFTGISWGIILMTTPACTSFAGIAVNRFMLGLVEAAVNPGFVLVMSMWYTAKEQPLRLETYYCTNGIATMFGGLLGYAIGHISGGIAKWMYVFIIFGAMSLVSGFATLWFLPDLPSTAKFLNQREKAVAIERVAANRQGVKNHNFKTDQAWQTVADPKTWILFILAVSAQVPNAAITSVSKTMTPSYLLRLTNITVHISDHQGLRIRNSRLPISSDSWWFCSVCCSHWRRLYLQQMAQLPLPHHDGGQHYLHCWSCYARRSTAERNMGSFSCPMAVLLPGTRLQHELDHDQQQHLRFHEEAAYWSYHVHWILRGQHVSSSDGLNDVMPY